MAWLGKRPILCTLLAAAVTAASALLLPWRVLKVDAGLLFERPRSQWEGVLTLWHLSGWRTATGSRSGQLERVASAFERANPGLYIDIEGITAGQYAARLAAGQRPDLITWPGGMIDPSPLPLAGVPLTQTLAGGLAASVPYGDDGALAVPWIWGGEVILINAAMAERRGAALPAGGEDWTAAELLELAGALMHRTGRTKSVQVYGVAAAGESLLSFGLPGLAVLTADLLDPGVQTRWQAWESFAAGRAGILLGSQWEAAAMERLRDQGKGFDVLIMPVPSDLVQAAQVQWIAAVDGGDAGRAAMAVGYIQSLLSPGNQRIISEKTGCLPVLPGCGGGVLPLLERMGEHPVIYADPLEEVADSVVREAALGDEAARRYVASHCFYTGAACIQPADDVE